VANEHHPLFQPWTHGRLRLRNRVVMAPMTRRMSGPGGVPSPATVEYYRRRAAYEVGLIISEGTHIDGIHAPDTFDVPRFHRAEQRAGWAKVVKAVQAEGGAFAPQLWHTGTRAVNPVGPVAQTLADGRTVKPLTPEQIAAIVARWADCAAAAQAIGCDALEIHGAHGYLLDSFLDPEINTRTDAYGGDEAGRMRLAREVVRAVRDAVGPDFPIILRLSQWRLTDEIPAKFPHSAALTRCLQTLRADGADIFHLSTHDATAAAFPAEHPTRTLAGWAKRATDAPVIAVGSVTVNQSMDKSRDGGVAEVHHPETALDLLDQGETDLLAVGRALLANPDWVPQVRVGNWRQLRPYERSLLHRLW